MLPFDLVVTVGAALLLLQLGYGLVGHLVLDCGASNHHYWLRGFLVRLLICVDGRQQRQAFMILARLLQN